MEINTNTIEIPLTFVYCLNSECKLKDTCIKYFAYKNVSLERKTLKVLNPKSLTNDGSCKEYKEKKIVRYAYGIPSSLFDKISYKNFKSLHSKFENHFGHTTYYKIKNGEKAINEKEQEYIKQQFIDAGYQGEINFEKYIDSYNW